MAQFSIVLFAINLYIKQQSKFGVRKVASTFAEGLARQNGEISCMLASYIQILSTENSLTEQPCLGRDHFRCVGTARLMTREFWRYIT
jgi:hypothetical protein